MATKCPKCDSAIKMVKDEGVPVRVRCENQKTEKVGSEFNEVGSCDFKINFKSKLYSLSTDDMKALLAGKEIGIKDGNKMKLDVNERMFTKIEFVNTQTEEDF